MYTAFSFGKPVISKCFSRNLISCGHDKKWMSTTCLLQYILFGFVHSEKAFTRLHNRYMEHGMYITLVIYACPYLYFSRVATQVRGSVQRGFVKTEVEMRSANFPRQIWKGYFTILTRISKHVPLEYVSHSGIHSLVYHSRHIIKTLKSTENCHLKKNTSWR
jgi:hypothetical protein